MDPNSIFDSLKGFKDGGKWKLCTRPSYLEPYLVNDGVVAASLLLWTEKPGVGVVQNILFIAGSIRLLIACFYLSNITRSMHSDFAAPTQASPLQL